MEDAAVAVTELESSPRGMLRINMPVTFGRRHVAPFFPDFMELYPEVEIEATMTDNLVNIIEEGADLVIRIGELQDSSLIARKLAPNHRVIAASPEYLEKYGEPFTPSDLADHVALTYRRQAGPDIFHFDFIFLFFPPNHPRNKYGTGGTVHRWIRRAFLALLGSHGRRQ